MDEQENQNPQMENQNPQMEIPTYESITDFTELPEGRYPEGEGTVPKKCPFMKDATYECKKCRLGLLVGTKESGPITLCSLTVTATSKYNQEKILLDSLQQFGNILNGLGRVMMNMFGCIDDLNKKYSKVNNLAVPQSAPKPTPVPKPVEKTHDAEIIQGDFDTQN